MFQFPRLAFVPYFIQEQILRIRNQKPEIEALRPQLLITDFWKWVSPFGNSRIKACSRLPMTYRSVPRPSSPLSAKASTEYPYGT